MMKATRNETEAVEGRKCLDMEFLGKGWEGADCTRPKRLQKLNTSKESFQKYRMIANALSAAHPPILVSSSCTRFAS